MKYCKKVLACLLCAVMLVSVLPIASYAEDEYVKIYTILDLYKIRNNLEGNYILMNNIDLTDATAANGDYDIDGHGWNPIGRNYDNTFSEFTGIFDGNGYDIIGMRIEDNDTNSLCYGLFGKVSGTIKNLNIVNAKVETASSYKGVVTGYLTGNVENIKIIESTIVSLYKNAYYSNYTGAIAGYAENANVKNIKIVNSTLSSGGTHLGGVIGYGKNTNLNCCAVKETNVNQECYGIGESNLSGTYSIKCGGIVGFSENCEIENSYTTGNVSSIFSANIVKLTYHHSTSGSGTWTTAEYGTAISYAGGIVGCAYTSNINNCYNIANVNAVARNSAKESNSNPYANGISYNGTVKNCYNFGQITTSIVSSSVSAGYAISNNNVSKCYFLKDCGLTINGAIGFSESLFKESDILDGFDFENIWFIDTSTGIARPQLISNPEVTPIIHEHNYTSETTKEATCTEAGVITYTCECGDNYTEEISALGHQNTKTINEKAPTCSEEGYTGDTYCEDCENIIANGEAIEKLPHTVETDKAVKPTCTETGLTTGEHCSVCKAVLTKQEVVEALGHQNTKTINEKAPTCSEEGYTGDTYCEDCENIIANGETIEMLPHTVETDKAVAPTCTETGLTAGEHCSVCNAVLTKQEVVEATGHTPAMSNMIPANCTETGLTSGTYCIVCGVVLASQEIIPAKGHTDENDDGWCDNCNAELRSHEPVTPPPAEPTKPCDCKCHSSGFSLFIWKIGNFFHKIFRMDKYYECACGEKHW